jgi:hypothetical protein
VAKINRLHFSVLVSSLSHVIESTKPPHLSHVKNFRVLSVANINCLHFSVLMSSLSHVIESTKPQHLTQVKNVSLNHGFFVWFGDEWK